MFILLFILGILLAAGGSIMLVMYLPHALRNVPLKEAFSELFDDDKVSISTFCAILGYIIIFFLMYCIGSAF